jgi:predicted RNA-binding protein with PIN domain
MSGLPTHKEDFAGYSHLALFCLFSISLFTLTTQKVLSFLASVDVIFSGETCADAWIEKEVVALREDGCPKVWVVTSDVCQQQAAHGAVLGHHIDVINSLCSYLVFDFGD